MPNEIPDPCPACGALQCDWAKDPAKVRAALDAAAACFDALDPRQPSGLSDAETASLFNSTREAVRLALE